MRTLHARSLAGILVLTMLVTACSNSKVTSSWKGPGSAKLAPGNKILVLGIIREKDIRLRMQMEGFLVDALKAKGYNAVSAYTLYGPKMFSSKDEESVLNQLRNSGIDDVFTITLLDKARERNFQPAAMYPYSPFWGYYNYWYGRVYSPGYVSVDTHFLWESNLYDVGSKKLLYSVQSRSTNPSSAGSMGKDYSKAVVKNMTKQGIL
ncbi:MAG TPA: hypothetical protein VIM64_02280 [Puia sp.]